MGPRAREPGLWGVGCRLPEAGAAPSGASLRQNWQVLGARVRQTGWDRGGCTSQEAGSFNGWFWWF